MKQKMLLFMALLCSVSLYAQNVSLNFNQVKLERVLASVTEQTGYSFAYSEPVIDPAQLVSINVSNTDVKKALKTLFDDAHIAYEIRDKKVFLSAKAVTNTNSTSNTTTKDAKTVKGKITSASGESLPAVNIIVKGTTIGVFADMDGNYSITIPDNVKDPVLRFAFMGYIEQELAVGNRGELSVILTDDVSKLDEVVVTALGIKREEKALGYATQKVAGDQFDKVKGVNITTSMTGKIAGLQILNSTEFMDDPKIQLRGEEPLLIIDGVPYSNMKLSDINSDDIQGVDVLKGATASALYGSRGGSGAIMVTTKKGGKKGLAISINSSNMFNLGTLAMPKVQSSYSAGYNGKYNTDDEVWGDKLDIGRKYMQWDPIAKEMREQELTSRGKDNFKNFLEFSYISNTNISISQQGENGGIRTSFSYLQNKGQYPNAKSQQFTYTIGGDMKLGDKLVVESSASFNKRVAPNKSGVGYGDQGYIYNILVWTGPEYDLSQYKDYWVKPNEVQNWHYDNWYDNPYLMAYEKLNRLDQNKFNGMFSVNYKFLPWAKMMFRTGLDFYQDQTFRQSPIGVNSTRAWGDTDKGFYSQKDDQGYSVNSDLIIMMDKRIGKFSIDALAGGTMFFYKTNSMRAETKNGISVPGFYSLKASVESPLVVPETKRKQVNSLFGKLTLGYNNAYYLDITGRNDWSSTLPSNDKSYFYPSVGASVIMSEIINTPSWVSFWKMRGSWTISKRDLDVYAINNSYKVNNSVWNGLNSATYPEYSQGKVKAITDRTYEIGTALYLLPKNRIKFDFSYYSKLTFNNTLKVDLSPLSGFKQTLINVDEELVRRGFEVSIDVAPILKENFKWNAILNWSTSRRYYANLDPTYSQKVPWVEKGARADAYTSREFIKDPNGNVVMFNGFPRRSDDESRIGYSDPNWIWGLTNIFRYEKFTLSMSVDGRVGGLSNSETNRRMWQTGAHPDSDNQWRYEEVVNGNKTYIADGVKLISGNISDGTGVFEKNTQVVSYETYIKDYWRLGPQLILDETFIKLREVSISYDMPTNFCKKLGLKSASVALIGQNLLLWTKEYKYADPDKATDDLSSPSVRYTGFNIKLNF